MCIGEKKESKEMSVVKSLKCDASVYSFKNFKHFFQLNI